MNRSSSHLWRALALSMILILAGAPIVRAGAEPVSLGGRIFLPDGTTALQGATVVVRNQETAQVYASRPTDAAGRYKFDDLPPGTYTFRVETDAGVFTLDRAVQLGGSDTASVSFTIKPEPDIPARAANKGMSKKKKGTLIAIIGGGAILLAVALDDDDDDASPFIP